MTRTSFGDPNDEEGSLPSFLREMERRIEIAENHASSHGELTLRERHAFFVRYHLVCRPSGWTLRGTGMK
jgi:hypothetical protein